MEIGRRRYVLKTIHNFPSCMGHTLAIHLWFHLDMSTDHILLTMMNHYNAEHSQDHNDTLSGIEKLFITFKLCDIIQS